MTEYWKAIKEFYSVEITDEYSEKASDKLIWLGEISGICTDKHDKKFIQDCINALESLLDSKQREMRINQ